MNRSSHTEQRQTVGLACAGQDQPVFPHTPGSPRPILFVLFFISGFCGLVYQLVWTRMAFAAFGIIAPVLSVVISVFMLGLSVGAWAAGKWIGPLTRRRNVSAAFYYALAEFGIGLGAYCVPKLFTFGQRLLQSSGETNSLTYLTFSALILAGALLPWCLFMGATYPLMMAYMRECGDRRPETFSFLYLANVLGATSGVALAALVLIEIFGFHDTLELAAVGNFSIALISLKLGWDRRASLPAAAEDPPLTAEPPRNPVASAQGDRFLLGVLFTTGFASMAMEVVWTRAFTPVLKTQVYSFAMVVMAYLAATFAGSWLYRRDLRRRNPGAVAKLILLLCLAAALPVVAGEACFQAPRLRLAVDGPLSVVLLLASICPFCGILGYLTPRLIDDLAAGAPAYAGTAYAINVLGCILGPLFASYFLLPLLNERHALLLLGLPFLGFFLVASADLRPARRLTLGLAAGGLMAVGFCFCRCFEEYVASTDQAMRSRRDYAASVIGVHQGAEKYLLVNGNNMTALTPVTKFMAHLPLAYHQGKPESALVVCFGMGTTFRSALSWDVNTTAVELVPSVPKLFGFFFTDAPEQLKNPRGKVVIDDGRRYLKRTTERFDVIIVDPPPPVEAAGSSLLYSKEFCDLAARHLKPGGILQTFVPENLQAAGAALRSLRDSFPYVRCYGSVIGRGVHMLASRQPIAACSPEELIRCMPAAARADLVEWEPRTNPAAYLGIVIAREFGPEKILPQNPMICISDDRPYNEYYLLRDRGWW
jgi:spermidine synthase